MKSTKRMFGTVLLLFIIATFACIVTLTTPVSAIDTGTASANGKWEFVCCGAACEGGQDYCVGSGSYTCCK